MDAFLLGILIVIGITVVGVLGFFIGRSVSKFSPNGNYTCAEVNRMHPEVGLMNGMSALRKDVSLERFKKAYLYFMAQADRNTITQKANGSRTPLGFEGNREYDGAILAQHFGQGAASLTPYLNWWVVSIYYITATGMIELGIEENRYPHINRMRPIVYKRIGNKNIRVAVFYSTQKNCINWEELYEVFLSVSEEVMRLGLR